MIGRRLLYHRPWFGDTGWGLNLSIPNKPMCIAHSCRLKPRFDLAGIVVFPASSTVLSMCACTKAEVTDFWHMCKANQDATPEYNACHGV